GAGSSVAMLARRSYLLRIPKNSVASKDTSFVWCADSLDLKFGFRSSTWVPTSSPHTWTGMKLSRLASCARGNRCLSGVGFNFFGIPGLIPSYSHMAGLEPSRSHRLLHG